MIRKYFKTVPFVLNFNILLFGRFLFKLNLKLEFGKKSTKSVYFEVVLKLFSLGAITSLKKTILLQKDAHLIRCCSRVFIALLIRFYFMFIS